MTLERYFNLSSYALLAASTALLAATRQLDAITLTLFGAALLLACVIDSGVGRWWAPRRWMNWLLIGGLLAAVAAWYFFDAALPPLTMRFLLFTVALRLLRQKHERDWRWLYTVSFLQVLFSAGLLLGTTFLALLIVYLFAALSTLVSFELRRAQHSFDEHRHSELNLTEYWREARTRRTRPPFKTPLKAPRWRNVALFAGAALVLIFVLAAPLFMAMPRLGRVLPSNFLRGAALSGFTESVRLGEVARIKLNPQVVMRVRVKFPPQAPRQWLRWRGLALDHYEDGNWSRFMPPPKHLSGDGYGFRTSEAFRPLATYTEQEFFLEPLDSNIVFAASRALRVSGPEVLKQDDGGALWTDQHAFHRFHYAVLSDTSVPLTDEMRADTSRFYPEIVKRFYLQLPEDHDHRLDKLAETITRTATSPYEAAQFIEQHLQNNYQYSLDLDAVEQGDPVCDFLFNTRTGHCEYFASAMVLLLRTRGIPARLVNGFQMGEYNRAGDDYTVRQSDAHSWVEAYFPKHGWVTFDPTPDAGLNTYADDWLAWFRHYGDALQLFWQERVVGFDSGEQLSMLMAAQRKLAELRLDSNAHWFDWQRQFNLWQMGLNGNDTPEASEQASGARALLQHPLALALLAFALVTLIALAWWRYRHSWRYRLQHDPARSAIAFYQEMLDTLAHKGQRRAPAQTPLEFAARLQRPPVTELTRLYQRARFSTEPLSAPEIARVQVLLGELKRQAG